MRFHSRFLFFARLKRFLRDTEFETNRQLEEIGKDQFGTRTISVQRHTYVYLKLKSLEKTLR